MVQGILRRLKPGVNFEDVRNDLRFIYVYDLITCVIIWKW